ncbi:MAG: YbgC/FadM family acyl-CoA thioesterase [Rubrivivax sp.]|nr:YbgC/FadM family acyl-CoA thioesterase [Rubrivivax sp.]
MKRADFRYLDRQRVRWAEVDLQRIVFNGHYLMYFDTAVAGWWRAMALPYAPTMHTVAGDFYVRKATLEYEASAHYDEVIHTGVRCQRIGRSSMVLQAATFRDDQRLVHGELVYVFADPATQTSRPVPEVLRQWFEGYEAGADMLALASGGWAALGADIAPLRQAVFVGEQQLPDELVHDATDDTALHVVARNRLGLAVGSGRLLQPEPGVGQVGRLATLAALRGAGIGRRVLDALLAAARGRGDREVLLQARTSATDFYRAAGFVADGSTFEEAGQPHVTMRRRL